MTNNISNLSQIPVAASTGTPPKAPNEGQGQPPTDQVSLGQNQAGTPSEPKMRKLVVSLDVDERLLTPDQNGQMPINNLEPVFIAKPEVAKQDPTHVPKVQSAEFAPDGGDLLVVPVPPHTNTSKFIAVPIEVPSELLQPTGKQNPDGSQHRGIDDFDAKLAPHDAVIKKPSDYQNDLQEAYDGGKNDYLPQGYTRVVANSKAGHLIEMGSGIGSKMGMVASGFGNMTLAGWNSMMGLATAGTLAGIGGAIGVLGALDQMKKLANDKGRLQFQKQNYEAGEARQSLLTAAPEAGPKYLDSLKTRFQAEHELLGPKAELKSYDDAIAKGTKKEEKGKLKPGEAEQLNALRAEQQVLKGKVDQLEAAAKKAAEASQAIRAQLPEDKAAKFDETLSVLAPQLQHYEANRGDQMSLSQAQIKALEAEGVGAVPMQTPQGIQNVPLDTQIKSLDTQVKVQGISAVASGLGMTAGILATVGIGCPPLLAAAAVLLPLAGMVLVVGKPIAMLGKVLWNKWFNKDQTPTPEKAVTGAKAKPEGPKETAAWEKAMSVRGDILKADKANGQGYLDSVQNLEVARRKTITAKSEEEAGKARAEQQKVALELAGYEQALEKSAPGKVAEFKQSLAELNDTWAESRAGDAMGEQFYKDVLSAGVTTRSADVLGLSQPQAERVMTTLLQAEFGHRESVETVQGWQSQDRSQMTPEAKMAATLIQVSQAIQKGVDPSKAVPVASKTNPAPEQPAPQTQAPQTQAPSQAPAPAQVDPQQARVQLEQEMGGLIQAVIQGDPQAQGIWNNILGEAGKGNPAAVEQAQVGQAWINQIAANAQGILSQATPEQVAAAKPLHERASSGDETVQTDIAALVEKAKGGDQASAITLQVLDALYISGRLGLDGQAASQQPPAEQQPAPQA